MPQKTKLLLTDYLHVIRLYSTFASFCTLLVFFFSVRDILSILCKNQIFAAIHLTFIAFEIIVVSHSYNKIDLFDLAS